MRADELVVLTKAEFDALKQAAQRGRDGFSAEELDAVREQYEERIVAERERCEDLEWKLRVELARIRDAELWARRAADDMRRVEHGIMVALDQTETAPVAVPAPSRALPAVAAKPVKKPEVAATLKKALPPPIPPAAARNGTNGTNGVNGTNSANGKHADKYRAAMNKRVVA
jgi:hypothetical protein